MLENIKKSIQSKKLNYYAQECKEHKEYVVTLHNYDDLDNFYVDMESMIEHDHIPNRSCECVNKRISSRNTHYLLSEEEASSLREDPRVLSVQLNHIDRGVEVIPHYTQFELNWDKSSSCASNHKNWGLLRSTRNSNISNWGSDVTPNQSGTATVSTSGRNVDVVIVDELVIPDHPEFAVNSDGSGGSRVNQINWFHYYPAAFSSTTLLNSIQGAGTLTQSLTPTVGSNADGYWTLTLPWDVIYYGGPTNKIHIGTNSYITFGENAGSTAYSGLGASNPGFPKIFLNAADRGCQRIYYGTEGSAPNRTYRVRWEGSSTDSGILGSPAMVWEAVFYESIPSRIDIHRGSTVSGGITGFYSATGLIASCADAVNTSSLFSFNTNYNYNYVTGIGDHGTHVAGTVAGNTQGWARDATIYSITPFVNQTDTSGVGVTEIFDVIREFHKNKPINPVTGVRNPTICNNSWGYSAGVLYEKVKSITWRGTTYNSPGKLLGDNIIASDTTDLVSGTPFNPTPNTGHRLSASGSLINITSITNTLLGAAALTDIKNSPSLTHPTFAAGDDSFYDITLPFSVNYNLNSYNTISVNSNSYVLFGGRPTSATYDYSAYYTVDASTPPFPKIGIGAGDRSVQRLYHGVEGSAPNRTYRIRYEGHTDYQGGVLGSPTLEWEMIFYENTPDQIDIQIGANGLLSSYGGFTTTDFLSYGVIPAGYSYYASTNQAQVPFVTWPSEEFSVNADVIDSISDGIIQVAAAGNSSYKHTKIGNVDYNNSLVYDWYGTEYQSNYHRGGTPDSTGTMICVGAISPLASELKADFSDCGERIDIYAPGEHIMSSIASGGVQYYDSLLPTVPDPRDSNYFLDKYGGTSMASPQVCGVLACRLEVEQTLNQSGALSWIASNSSTMPNSPNPESYTNLRHLQGSPARYLYFKETTNYNIVDINTLGAANFNNTTVYHVPTSIGDVSPTFSSVANVYSQTVPVNFVLNDAVLSLPGSGQSLQRQVPGYLLGRRPGGKQLYPRGVFNR